MFEASLWFAVAFQNQQPQRIASLTGNIQKLDGFESKVLKNKRNITVYLPPSYKTETKRRFPVIYMHDGQNVFDGMTSYIPNQEWRADEAAESLINAGIIEPVIIVAIDNGGSERGNEYLPTKIKMGDNEFGGKADLYGKMLTDEIMPLINQKYRTKTGPENTGLIGSSLGGVISSYLGIIHPDIFGRLGVCSPSVWVDNQILLKLVTTPKNAKRPKVWIDCGGQEPGSMVSGAKALYDVYVKDGWKPKTDIILLIEPNAGHNETAWARRLPSILTYLFPKK
jgi:predicted alpha/beta superfamily hydrolase